MGPGHQSQKKNPPASIHKLARSLERSAALLSKSEQDLDLMKEELGVSNPAALNMARTLAIVYKTQGRLEDLDRLNSEFSLNEPKPPDPAGPSTLETVARSSGSKDTRSYGQNPSRVAIISSEIPPEPTSFSIDLWSLDAPDPPEDAPETTAYFIDLVPADEVDDMSPPDDLVIDLEPVDFVRD